MVVELNPYQILVAEVSQPPRGAVVLEAVAEFDRHDTDGLRLWLESHGDGRGWTDAICGLVPMRGIVHRESVQPRRLAEPMYLSEVVQEQQKGRFLSATPFKIVTSNAWTLRAVGAIDGDALPTEGAARPALICGLANDELREAHEGLLEQRLKPERIEAGLLAYFGAVSSVLERRNDSRAVGIVVVHETATSVYILGKEGVHTPNPILHGFSSIVELTRKELGGDSDDQVRDRLHHADPELLNHAAKLVRRIGRDLKPVIDSFEMTTGQPVDEILCAYLPPKLAWIAEPLARATARTAMVVDCNEWLPAAGLHVAEGVPAFGPHWLGALSLVANLPEGSRLKSERTKGSNTFHRPWHVDCRLAIEAPDRRLPDRYFMTGFVGVGLAVLTLALTGWQLYATRTLNSDTEYWEKQMADNRKLFDDLAKATAELKKQDGLFKSAYTLMHAPYQLTNFFISLGKTVPGRMRLDRIETNDTRVAIGGALFEPAEEASATLNRYMDELRRNPSIGPLFSRISITSLQRETDDEAVLFEITLRHN